jgi:1-acyl-sn-glycerol-3-phosphate acyltransferase
MYYIVRPIARVAIRIFYRKIHISHLERIPQDKPVILAANHPTAFMEPCVMAVFLPQPLYFLVRGDFFVHRFYRFLLNSLKMLPIYRIIDAGYSGLKNNFATFEACADSLAKGRTIMIFPEGNTTHEKRMRPVKKGLARIVAGTLEKYPDLEEIFVVPVGFNYTYAERPRSAVMIDVGEPIPAKAYFKNDPRRAITELTNELKARLEERVIIVRKHADEQLAEYLFLMARSHFGRAVFPVVNEEKRLLDTEIAIAEKINRMDSGEKAALELAAAEYFARLDAVGIDDMTVVHPLPSGWATRLLWWLSAPAAWLGRGFCAPPMQLAWYIRKTRVERIEFFAPVLMAVSMGCFVVYFLLWLLVAAITGTWLLIPLAFALGGLGYFGILHREWGEETARGKYFRRVSTEGRIRLQEMRDSLVRLSGLDKLLVGQAEIRQGRKRRFSTKLRRSASSH